MAFFDLSGPELAAYRGIVKKPADFVKFWSTQLAAAREWDLGATFRPVVSGLNRFTFYDGEYTGFGGQRVKCWYGLPVPAGPDGSPLDFDDWDRQLRSSAPDGKFPVVVQYHGYGGGRGLPIDNIDFLSAGFGLLVMDLRGQGANWRRGDTPDGGKLPEGGLNPQVAGFMTRGILAPENHYFTRLITDAARAAEAAATAPHADGSRTIMVGGSQGGALTIASAALTSNPAFAEASLKQGWEAPDSRVLAALPDVPFLCDVPRAIGLVDTVPYVEVAKYLQIHRAIEDRVLRTFSYLDGVNFAGHGNVPALFSTALMDDICPPSTVYAAFNAWAGPKEIEVYRYNGHEGGQRDQFMKQLAFVSRILDQIRP